MPVTQSLDELTEAHLDTVYSHLTAANGIATFASTTAANEDAALPTRYVGIAAPREEQRPPSSRPPRSVSPPAPPSPRALWEENEERASYLIRTERRRQIVNHGYSTEKNRQYVNGELMQAAKAYEFSQPSFWPSNWEPGAFKLSYPMRNLVKAGALVLAERERIEHGMDWGSDDPPDLVVVKAEHLRLMRKIAHMIEAVGPHYEARVPEEQPREVRHSYTWSQPDPGPVGAAVAAADIEPF